MRVLPHRRSQRNKERLQMFKKLAASVVAAVMLSTSAFAAGEATGHVENIDFSFDGPFGSYVYIKFKG